MTNDERFPDPGQDEVAVRHALRAELAAEPVPVDSERRDTAIRAALDATAGTVGPIRTADRRRSPAASRWRRPALVAAASVAVLAATGVGLLVSSGDSTDETASVKSFDDFSTSTDQIEERSADWSGDLAQPLLPTPHLGDFESVETLLAEVGRRSQDTPERLASEEPAWAPLTGPSDGSSPACPPDADAPSRTVLGSATLNGEPVNVAVDTEGGLFVLSIDGCRELARA
jgi:hypothetical protein